MAAIIRGAGQRRNSPHRTPSSRIRRTSSVAGKFKIQIARPRRSEFFEEQLCAVPETVPQKDRRERFPVLFATAQDRAHRRGELVERSSLTDQLALGCVFWTCVPFH